MKAAPLAMASSWFKVKDSGLPNTSASLVFTDGTLVHPPMTSTESRSSAFRPATSKAFSIGTWILSSNGLTISSSSSLVN
ncbi:hypothetical protein OGATHE_006062 [Ogataea polymorpha]|uniref:Uncharacterized protein n=1 Tax=Ogataea polymorpha TaxID=460523 RepID=A0A9P8SYL3_9ASCO|nr:hypothetical protein OGATHE_006062 [Ogataea polymorpha]